MLPDVSELEVNFSTLALFFSNATVLNIPQSTSQLKFSEDSMRCLSCHIYFYFVEDNSGGKKPKPTHKPKPLLGSVQDTKAAENTS